MFTEGKKNSTFSPRGAQRLRGRGTGLGRHPVAVGERLGKERGTHRVKRDFPKLKVKK